MSFLYQRKKSLKERAKEEMCFEHQNIGEMSTKWTEHYKRYELNFQRIMIAIRDRLLSIYNKLKWELLIQWILDI